MLINAYNQILAQSLLKSNIVYKNSYKKTPLFFPT